MSDQPYDPYIPSGQSGASSGARGDGNQRTAALQAEIDSTVNVMRSNINKVSERGENLDSLQSKTDNLADRAKDFRHGSNKVMKSMRWKDRKWRCILILTALCIIGAIIGVIVWAAKR